MISRVPRVVFLVTGTANVCVIDCGLPTLKQRYSKEHLPNLLLRVCFRCAQKGLRRTDAGGA